MAKANNFKQFEAVLKRLQLPMFTVIYADRMEMVDRLLDDLIPALRQKGSQLALEVADVLGKWDRQANSNSRGAVLFAAWVEQVNFDTLFSKPWQDNSPRNTPDGLANPQKAVAILLKVANKVKTDYGSLDIPWGKVFRLQNGNINLPANGGSGGLGIFRVVDFEPIDRKRFRAVQGDSFVAAIEFSQPVKAMALTSYGNATQPNSTDVGDRLKLFSQKRLRPVWRLRQEVKANLVEHTTWKVREKMPFSIGDN
jgi:acyl-homoserine-lactone acylase